MSLIHNVENIHINYIYVVKSQNKVLNFNTNK